MNAVGVLAEHRLNLGAQSGVAVERTGRSSRGRRVGGRKESAPGSAAGARPALPRGRRAHRCGKLVFVIGPGPGRRHERALAGGRKPGSAALWLGRSVDPSGRGARQTRGAVRGRSLTA